MTRLFLIVCLVGVIVGAAGFSAGRVTIPTVVFKPVLTVIDASVSTAHPDHNNRLPSFDQINYVFRSGGRDLRTKNPKTDNTDNPKPDKFGFELPLWAGVGIGVILLAIGVFGFIHTLNGYMERGYKHHV